MAVHQLRNPSPDASCDGVWRAITQHANEAFESGYDALARALYEAALREADRVLELACIEADVEAMGVAPVLCHISCCNLAELALRQGNVADAGDFLGRSFEVMIATATEELLPIELRAAAVRQLRVATSALVNHHRDRGNEAGCERVLARARAIVLEVERELRRAVLDDAVPRESGLQLRGAPRA